MNKFIFQRLMRAFSSLLIAGALIGFLHSYDIFLAMLLAILLFYVIYREIKKEQTEKKIFILISGTVLCAVFGFLVEFWGVTNGYWTYHDLDGREFPYWLPFAWALTFPFLYRFEESILKVNTFSFKTKIAFVAITSAVLPTWGEIITINLGVWTYHWPYQFFGVPLLAIFLLMVFHTFVFLFYFIYCKKNGVKNNVFNP